MVTTRSAAKKLANASQTRHQSAPDSVNTRNSRTRVTTPPTPAATPLFRTALIGRAGVTMTVEPSATGQGVHTRWDYGPPPQTSGTAIKPATNLSPTSSTSSSSGSLSPSSQANTPTNDRFATPAPRDSFYPASALCTPRPKQRAAHRSPRRIGALTEETQRYQMAMQDAINTHLTHSSSPPTPTVGRTVAYQESRENVFNAKQPGVKDLGLGKPVALRKAPLDRYDTIRWDEGCGETPSQEEQTSPRRASPLSRCTDTTVRPLLGPEGTQIIGPQGTHLLLGASAGPIFDTQIITPDDSLMDIEMDIDGHLNGPIGPNGEKLNPEGKQRLGPQGTFLHYDVNRLVNRFMDQRMEALGFGERGPPPLTQRLGPHGTELLE